MYSTPQLLLYASQRTLAFCSLWLCIRYLTASGFSLLFLRLNQPFYLKLSLYIVCSHHWPSPWLSAEPTRVCWHLSCKRKPKTGPAAVAAAMQVLNRGGVTSLDLLSMLSLMQGSHFLAFNPVKAHCWLMFNLTSRPPVPPL